MIALARAPGRGDAADFSLGLAVAKADQDAVVESAKGAKESGYNLSVKWDRSAAAVRAAQRGVLEIEDGKYTKSVDLDTAQLSNGGCSRIAAIADKRIVFSGPPSGVAEASHPWMKAYFGGPRARAALSLAER